MQAALLFTLRVCHVLVIDVARVRLTLRPSFAQLRP